MMHDDSNQALAAAVETINIKLHQLIIADSMSDRDPEKTMILLSISVDHLRDALRHIKSPTLIQISSENDMYLASRAIADFNQAKAYTSTAIDEIKRDKHQAAADTLNTSQGFLTKFRYATILSDNRTT
jgi:hypothetical protein